MREIKTLLEQFWICKDTDKEGYYRTKREIPQFQRFVREQLGWKLIHTENLLKLEKLPAHAESFMGIQEFSEVRDYCILCVALMFLEDREEQEQFLLSELIDYVGTQLSPYRKVDWTSFSQRKSLVRVLKYMEGLHMLRVYEGSSEAFGQEAGREVLYENTGYYKYFAVSFGTDISDYHSWRDFEGAQLEDVDEERGIHRIHRVYRQLAVCPVFCWKETDDADALYLKNQRAWIAKNLQEQMGGRLDVHRNAAFLMFEEGEGIGALHPRDAMLPEAVLLVCARIRELLKQGVLNKTGQERIVMPKEQFFRIVLELREQWKGGWSKEYREMEEMRLLEQIVRYMKDWMMLRETDEQIELLPSVGKLTGSYPKDFEGGATE